MRRALERGACGEHAVDDEVVAFLAGRAGGDARTALAALELACETAPAGEPITLDARRGRAAAPRADLRQDRRPPLRHDLGLDQGHARVGPRRVAVLPRGHARGRRGPALHRPPDGHPRLRGHRQRRPARRCRSRSPPRTRSSTSACPRRRTRSPSARSTSRSRRSRNAAGRALRRRPRPRPRARRPAPARLPAQRRLPRRALRSAAARATTTPTTTPATSAPRSCCPTPSSATRFYEPDDAEAALRERLEAIRRARER